MKFGLNKHISCVGLDIQPHEIRLVQLRQTRNSFVLEYVIRHQVTSPLIVDDLIQVKALTDALSTLAESLPAKEIQVSFCLPAHWVKMQIIQVPRYSTSEEIIEAIKQEVVQTSPYGQEALCIDYTVLCTKEDCHEIYFAVAKEALVTQVVQAIHTVTNFHVKIIDIDLYALIRLMTHGFDFLPTEQVQGLLQLTDRNACLVLFNDERILFHTQWQYSHEKELDHVLKDNIEFGLSLQQTQQLSCLTVSGESTEVERLFAITPIVAKRLRQFDLSSVFITAAHLGQAQLKQDAHYLLAASGAAMRRVPKW
ncbi:MAG: pilus assembly protein PilM [Gammaproteobacteria bacterium]|nr:pilus assembly protein PilM [Gammaproteobacteria bacterium]